MSDSTQASQKDMSEALSEAWDEIEQGTLRRMDQNRQRLQELYSQETKPTLVGHVESEEVTDIKTDDVTKDEPERPPQTKTKSIFTTDEDEQLQEALGEQAAIDERDERLAKAKEQSDIDLESEMEKDMNVQTTEDDGENWRELADSTSKEPTEPKDGNPRDPANQSTVITTTAEILEEGYEKHYMTGAQDREARTAARREQQKQKELKEQAEKEAQAAQLAKQAEEEAEGRRIVERALLQEEEAAAKKILAEKCRVREGKKPHKTDEERKRKKPRREEEIEEEEEVDDEDADPNYDPDKDPDNEFIDDASMVPEDEDVVEVDKHSHAINFKDSVEYVKWIRDNLTELERATKMGGGIAERSYKKFIEKLQDGIMQMETYSPIEYADVQQVLKTVVDTSCIAWRKKLKGVKTGNCRTIMKAEEKKSEVLRAAEDAEVPSDVEGLLGEDSLKGKTPEEQRQIRLTIKRFFQHVSRAHEEASCAAGKLAELVEVLDWEEFNIVARAGTCPLVAIEFPEIKKVIEDKKEEVRKAEIREELKAMDIKEIIAIQNLPTPLERWKDSKVLLPTRYLAAATHYFIYSQAVQEAPMTNKLVAKKFDVSLSTLHRITSGRRYAGGHETTKAQMGEHGEVTVKVVKKKEKGKIAVTKVPATTQGDLDKTTPAQGIRKRRRSSKEDEEDN